MIAEADGLVLTRAPLKGCRHDLQSFKKGFRTTICRRNPEAYHADHASHAHPRCTSDRFHPNVEVLSHDLRDILHH